MDITGFLFGNVNEEGELEDETLLDKECVSQLARLGVAGELSELVSEGEGQLEDEEEESLSKAPTAQDFADIAEVADEEPVISAPVVPKDDTGDRFYKKGVEFAYSNIGGASSSIDDDYDEEPGVTSSLTIAADQSVTDNSVGGAVVNTQATAALMSVVDISIPTDTAHNVDIATKQDAASMDNQSQDSGIGSQTPPPSLDVSEESLSLSTPSELVSSRSGAQPPATDSEDTLPDLPENMSLDELYAKVKRLFPGFKPNSILRFSSLLGPGKPSSLPKLWSEAKKPQKRKKPAEPVELKLDCDFIPPDHMINTDDEESFHMPVRNKLEGKVKSGGSGPGRLNANPETMVWRFGPAKVWYDQLGVTEDGSNLNYGFKLKESTTAIQEKEEVKGEDDPPEDAFLMVTQQHWEDKILWDVPYTPGPAITGAGGVWRAVGDSPSLMAFANKSLGDANSSNGQTKTLSMFPVENFDLCYRRWEDDIIYDSEAVEHIPRPSLPQIDPNDPNFILGIPEEPPPNLPSDKEKKDSKKSRVGPGRSKAGSDSTAGASGQTTGSFLDKKDPFNLSNDEYYNPRHVSSSQSLSGLDSHVVQHSSPALDLHPAWFPTHLSHSSLRNFHRPKLRVRCPRRDTTTGYYNIIALNKHIAKKAKEREKERVNSGGGEVFFMRTPQDLSVSDGDIVLAELSEQYPPLISTIGMATKVKNYYRRPERQVKSHAPQLKFGETTYVQTTSSYFLGQLRPGQTLSSVENNLYRAPVYPHKITPTDFLLIVAGDKVHIRKVEDIFVVGQQCPKVEVPAPNSKPAMQFQKELLQVYLYRLFRDNEDEPKRIKMEAIRKAFPSSVISESVIRKVLKTCADFKREGYETGWWVLRQDFRLPSDEEIRSMITPEQVCTYHSMLAAEHKLKEAGYRGKSLFSVEDEEEDSNNKIDDEIRAAPWNTTHHFINATKGKYQLSVSGPTDPTGCGEGFSYSRITTKRESPGNLPAGRRYKNVMGTDGDLRKLKLSKAKALLRNFGVPEDEISKLSRWQVVDRVRELSTEAARSGDSVDIGNLKFARGARFSQMEAQERYKEECQRVFDLQNTVLSSAEVLSTDEDSSNSGGESDEELGRNLETLLRGKKTSAQLSHEQEEAERQELRRMLAEDKPMASQESIESNERGSSSLVIDNDDASSVKSFSSTGRRLVISRTFRDEDGKEFVRDEVVKRPDVIAAYIKLSSDVRSKFIQKDEVTREDMRKEKRKIQDELRRLRKMEEREKKKALKPKKEKPLTTINMRCSACGQKGHMKTNRNCPNYKNSPVVVAPTDSEVAQLESSLSQDDLVKVEGTKVVLNRAVVEHAIDVRRKSLLLKFPKEKLRKRRRQAQEEDLDYLETRKSVQRRRTNPEVPFSDLLEKIVQSLVGLAESYHFRKPVQAKIVPDYYDVIKFPMDLQTMKENCRKHMYKSRDAFWEHINLIVTNCITYNGSDSEVTGSAQKMLEACEEEMKKVERELEQLETEINPALDDNALVAFSYLLSKVVDEMRAVPESWAFHHPVSARKIPDYHKIIKKPMDLQTMRKNCNSRRYLSREQFLSDLNQVVENSITYNGPSSPYTQTAQTMRDVGMKLLEQDAEVLSQLEMRLNVDVESVATPTSDFEESGMELSGRGEGQWATDPNDLGELLQDLEHSSSSSSDSEMED